MSAVPPDFRPRGAGTGLGPMPGEDPETVVALAVEHCPELPFWPGRPRAVPAEGPLGRWAAGLPGVETGDDGRARWVGRGRAEGRPAPPPESLVTLEPFLKALAGRPAGWCLLPALGPVSLALALDAGGQAAFTSPGARGPLGVGYPARLRSVVSTVREALPDWKVVLLLDEPVLGDPRVAAAPALAVELWRGLGATGAEVTGIRLGAGPSWPLVLDLDPQLVAFDAQRDGDAATDDPAFRRLVEAGTAVAWGLAGGDSTPDSLAQRLVDLVTWTAGDYLPEVLARSMVTPVGGLATADAATAAARLDLAASAGVVARDLAGLP